MCALYKILERRCHENLKTILEAETASAAGQQGGWLDDCD
jgi:hypothetical protein